MRKSVYNHGCKRMLLSGEFVVSIEAEIYRITPEDVVGLQGFWPGRMTRMLQQAIEFHIRRLEVDGSPVPRSWSSAISVAVGRG